MFLFPSQDCLSQLGVAWYFKHLDFIEGWKELQKNPNFLLKVIRWGVNMLHAAKG